MWGLGSKPGLDTRLGARHSNKGLTQDVPNVRLEIYIIRAQ